MKNTIELAAEFIRRAAFVDANALLKDECGVEYKKPSQVQWKGDGDGDSWRPVEGLQDVRCR